MDDKRFKEYMDFLPALFDHAGFPAEAGAFFLDLETKIHADRRLDGELTAVMDDYYANTARDDLKEHLQKVSDIADKYGLSNFSLILAALLRGAPVTLERYRAAGIDEAVFWQGTKDYRCKMLECKECKGVWGTFVGSWFDDFYDLQRFALGRFQYLCRPYDGDTFTTVSGFTLHNGDMYCPFHIPSLGIPLTDDVRNDSYRRAFEFFKDKFDGRHVVLSTSSWLIYPEGYKFLPENSNLRRFMDDFDIVSWEIRPSFGDAWRLFGHYAPLPPEQWPEDTSLRRAYKKQILSGGHAGNGVGYIFLEDGVNVTHRDRPVDRDRF